MASMMWKYWPYGPGRYEGVSETVQMTQISSAPRRTASVRLASFQYTPSMYVLPPVSTAGNQIGSAKHALNSSGVRSASECVSKTLSLKLKTLYEPAIGLVRMRSQSTPHTG